MNDKGVNGLVVKECDRCNVAQVGEWLSGAVASSFGRASTLDGANLSRVPTPE
jgi:hypothetical protein